MSGAGWSTLGEATTHGRSLPLGTDDPVFSARAVRRALAAAGLRAVDVEALAVASSIPAAPDALARFARRALGPHGHDVGLSAACVPRQDASTLADHAAALLRDITAASGSVAIAVGLAADGTTTARCLRLARPASDA